MCDGTNWENKGGVTDGGRENKKDRMYPTVFSMTPYSATVIVKYRRKSISLCEHLALDVVFHKSVEIVEGRNANLPRAFQESTSVFLERSYGRKT